MRDILRILFQLFHIYVGGATLFKHLEYNEIVWIGTRVSIFLMAVFDVLHWNTRGLIGSPSSSYISRNRSITSSADLPKTTTSYAFKKYLGRTSFIMFFKCSHHVSNSSLVRLYQTMQTQVVQPYAFNKDLLPDDVVVTHVVTCQGRDHVVNILSRCQSLVIINVHFEPDLTLRSLRERLRLLTPHWPRCPEDIGSDYGVTSILASQRKEDPMFGIRPSPSVTRERSLYFLAFSKLPNLTKQGEALRSIGLSARCPGLIERLSIFLRLKHGISITTPMFSRTSGKEDPYEVIVQLYASSFNKRLFVYINANAFRVGCRNIPFSA